MDCIKRGCSWLYWVTKGSMFFRTLCLSWRSNFLSVNLTFVSTFRLGRFGTLVRVIATWNYLCFLQRVFLKNSKMSESYPSDKPSCDARTMIFVSLSQTLFSISSRQQALQRATLYPVFQPGVSSSSSKIDHHIQETLPHVKRVYVLCWREARTTQISILHSRHIPAIPADNSRQFSERMSLKAVELWVKYN